MKDLHYCMLIFAGLAIGCSLFSKTENVANNSAVSSVSNNSAVPSPSASPTVEEEDEPTYIMSDYVGRWGKSLSGADHVIELREDQTGTITLDEGSQNEAKQDFKWRFEAKNVVFMIKQPVVNKKIIDSGTYTVHAKLTDGGKKLKTDFDTLWRGRGESIFEEK